MEDYLSDEEMALIDQFVKNNKMCEAVRKVLLAGIYYNGTLEKGQRAIPTKNFALGLYFSTKGDISNEMIGQDLRACAEGITVVENAFNKLIGMAIKEKEETGAESNPAR
jgi:hypothetical protein